MKESEMKLVSEKGENRRKERLREKGETVERLYRRICADSREDSENLRKVEIWRSSAIWEESRKSVGKVLEEYWKNFGRVAFS